MKNQSRKSLIFSLITQTVVAVFFGIGLSRLVFMGFHTGKLRDVLAVCTRYLPTFLILVLSLIPQVSLLIKHKLHSLDGEILPSLFLVISFQAAMIVKEAVDAFGYVFYLNEYLLYFQRFTFLGISCLFLLASLRYYGFASSEMGRITLLFLAFPLLLSTMVPLSSHEGIMELGSSWYEVFLEIAEAAIYMAAVVTFIIVAFKDGTALNVKRTLAFLLLIAGLYLTRIQVPYVALVSILLYIPGIVLLTHIAGDSI